MKKFLIRLLTLLFPSLLTWLGVTGCMKYGVPTCGFKFDIKVVDESGVPIKGIQVVPQGKFEGYLFGRFRDTVYTGSDGRVEKSYLELDGLLKEFEAILEDVDGDANGGYFKKDTLKAKPMLIRKGRGEYDLGDYYVAATKTLKK